MPLFIDIHALQSLPPNNINRDDTGAPKSATFGGVPRQRVSSQAWKRAIRKDFSTYLPTDQLGYRTKRVVEKIVNRIESLAEDQNRGSERTTEEYIDIVKALFKAAKIKLDESEKNKKDDDMESVEQKYPETGYLLFLSDSQIQNIAQTILEDPDQSWNKKRAAELLDSEHSIDIALFGRMVAEEPAYNVDASVQVAHAMGVSGSEPEFDFFTAVDDEVESAEETGAGMLGTVQMMSSTLYRYATINVPALAENLGSNEVAVDTSVAFIRSFINSLPSGKQNTFAHNTLPEFVVVALRKDRPISWVNAFEEPVAEHPEGGSRVEAARRLVDEANAISEMYDNEPEQTWVLAASQLKEIGAELGELTTHNQLLHDLETALNEAL